MKRLIPTLLALSLGGCHALGDHVHSVDDRVLRSGQMEARDLEELIADKGIKTVVNLRGPDDEGWYFNEKAACERQGVKHGDVRFVARRAPHKYEMLAFFDVLDKAEYPLLMHCQGGSDRVGLASATYLLLKGEDVDTATGQLTIFCGHFYSDIDSFFELYQTYKESGGEHDFREWVEQDYDEAQVKTVRRR